LPVPPAHATPSHPPCGSAPSVDATPPGLPVRPTASAAGPPCCLALLPGPAAWPCCRAGAGPASGPTASAGGPIVTSGSVRAASGTPSAPQSRPRYPDRSAGAWKSPGSCRGGSGSAPSGRLRAYPRGCTGCGSNRGSTRRAGQRSERPAARISRRSRIGPTLCVPTLRAPTLSGRCLADLCRPGRPAAVTASPGRGRTPAPARPGRWTARPPPTATSRSSPRRKAAERCGRHGGDAKAPRSVAIPSLSFGQSID
jgi:hypothetical protein